MEQPERPHVWHATRSHFSRYSILKDRLTLGVCVCRGVGGLWGWGVTAAGHLAKHVNDQFVTESIRPPVT